MGSDEAGLAGKVVLVTGAGGGIGSACVRAAAAAGATVVLNHLGDHAPVSTLAAELSGQGVPVLACEADVADWPAVEAMIAEVMATFGRLDVLVNNAGIMLEQPFLATSEADWHRTIRVDLDGVFVCSRHAAPAMLDGGGGIVVNVASQLALKGAAGFAAYCAAKAGVIGLTRAMARELGPAIRVNAVAPGPVSTPMTAPYQDESWLAERTGPLIIGRLAEADEVARAILFLAGDGASLMHGQTLHANGGGVMQ